MEINIGVVLIALVIIGFIYQVLMHAYTIELLEQED